MRARILAVGVLAAFAARASAANLDVTASYRMRALSYKNLALDLANKNDHSFIANDARLGVAIRKISLESKGGEESTLDLGLVLHALGASGSSSTLRGSPFDRTAAAYPSSDFTPFIENAYLKVTGLFGWPVEATFGRQTFRLSSGLLLDDDGAGLTGAAIKGNLPWGGLRLQGFLFHDANILQGKENSLSLYGLSLDLPAEGTWKLSQLFERDKAPQPVYGCVNGAFPGTPCLVSQAFRSFTSLHYSLSYGPMVFDGEAAFQRGTATPTGPTPSPTHVVYQGDAQVLRAKWKQRLMKTGDGVARLSVARGSGDDPGTPTKDEAFFPSRGHRYNGLERSGFGEFFAATPYDAYGGNYSSTTVSGLREGASGILVVGAGYTPPAYRGVALDIDYYLFQADRVRSGSRTLGWEWDFRLRYAIREVFTLSATTALFTAGTASNPSRGSARKYAFEASARF